MRGAAFAAIACLGAGVSADELAWRQENASLSLSGYMQFRSTLNARDVDIPGAEAFSRGFSLRRTRLTASGEVGEISYKLTASFSRLLLGPVWTVGFMALGQAEIALGVACP